MPLFDTLCIIKMSPPDELPGDFYSFIPEIYDFCRLR